jgi:uncharacterized membrane protein
MPNQAQTKRVSSEQRKQRLQRIVFLIIAVILIFSWIASLIAK